MGVINQLSFDVANLIAAGEVVDRPASAIKELMENSIDAGAKRITVEIKNGGVTFMRVSDDGCGMEPEDLPVAILRHATSKISSAEDLDGIVTLGFRGEALAAISAVSKIRIISKRRESPMGAVLDAHYGEILGLNEQGASNGTTIIVEELFSNVPARRKFLKRDITESTFVGTNVEKIALSHPEIAIRYIADGQIKLETAGDGNLKNTIYAVYGKDFAQKLIPVDMQYDGIRVTGFIGRSDNVKGNRGGENFYINNRFIKSKTATAAIEQAYSSYMPSEKFPVCVLFITLSPGRVDVNVHPAKLEVKFSNEKPVFEAVYYAVKQALESSAYRPEIFKSPERKNTISASQLEVSVERGESQKKSQMAIDFVTGSGNQDGFRKMSAAEYVNTYVSGGKANINTPTVSAPKAEPTLTSAPISTSAPTTTAAPRVDTPKEQVSLKVYSEQVEDVRRVIPKEDSPAQGSGQSEIIPSYESFVKQTKIEEKKEAAPTPSAPVVLDTEASQNVSSETTSWRYIGEAFNSYILCEVGEKLLIIDKHAAHERILFEDLKANMYRAESSSQLLMIPIEVMLMSDEIQSLEQYRSEIEGVGFAFTSARNTVFVSEIPSGVETEDVAGFMAVIAERLRDGTGNIEITRNLLFEKALYQASCKAAIKAGREYPKEHNLWIIRKLMDIPDITVCPHGRPVAMEFSKKNMDRQFERT